MKSYIAIFIFLLLTIALQGQSVETGKDLKVGLVLSGGGAKGFAHIGALKVIEDAGIRVDYIGGTSMGAIIGSLYASGYSTNDIENIIREKNTEFNSFMQDEISRKSKPFYQKENDHKYVVKLSVKDKKIQLPTGLTNGQSFLNQFSKYTRHVNNIKDFNQLPIPFLCVATDLVKGEQVVLNSGYLPDAVRASASFPTLLKPVEIDGKLLVDGGVVNNFPVDEVFAMGADIVIGVDVGDGKLLKKEEINTVVDVLNQVVSYQMLDEDDLAKKDKTTVYIRPDITKYSVMSFDKYEEILQEGYKASITHLNELSAIAKQQIIPKKEYAIAKIPDEFVINSIKITGNENYTYSYIIEKLQIHLGKKINFNKFFNGIDRLSATDNYTNIQHKIFLTEDGKLCNIAIHVTENPIKTHVQMGVHYDDLYKTGVLLNITSKHLLLDNDFISADVVIGERPRYNFTYFVDNGVHLSVGLKSVLQNYDFDTHFNLSNTSFNSSVNYLNLDYLDVSNRLFIQAVFKDNFAIKLGVEQRYLSVFTKNIEENSGDNELFFEKSSYGNLCGSLKFDTFDERGFPKKGIFFEAIAKWHLVSTDFQNNFKPFLQGKAKFGYAFTFADKFTTQFDSEAGVSFTENNNPYLDFHLGGYNGNYLTNFSSFHGYPFASIGNNSYLKSSLSLRYELLSNHFISGIANFARAEKNILKGGEIFNNTKSGYALQYAVKTLAGPISFTYSYSPEVKDNFWYINIGYWF